MGGMGEGHKIVDILEHLRPLDCDAGYSGTSRM